jgi:hypothetical protein
MDPTSNMLISSTVMVIPFPIDISVSSLDDVHNWPYMILFDNGTTALILLSQMSGLISPPPVSPSPSHGTDALLPLFLQLNSRITYEHEGQYHKGWFGQRDSVYRFSFKSHINKWKEEWGVLLPSLPTTWANLCIEGILIPGHVSHSFIWSISSSVPTTFNLVASFVSAVNLHHDCPPSLLKALADSHPDQDVWLARRHPKPRHVQEDHPRQISSPA